MPARVIVTALLMLVASPALAQHKALEIADRGDAALFVVAVLGLILGRHVSRRAPRHDDDNAA